MVARPREILRKEPHRTPCMSSRIPLVVSDDLVLATAAPVGSAIVGALIALVKHLGREARVERAEKDIEDAFRKIGGPRSADNARTAPRSKTRGGALLQRLARRLLLPTSVNRSRFPLRIAIAVMLFADASFAQERRPDVSGEIAPLPVPSGHTVPPEHPVVTFTSTKEGAVLQQARDYHWVSVCTAPCKVALDPAGTFQIDGPGMMTSRTFRLQPGASRIETRPSSTWLTAGGVVVASVGAVPTAFGLLILSFTLCSKNSHSDDCGSSSDRGFAAMFLVPGVLAVTAGIGMVISGRTVVDVDGASGLALGGGVRLGARGLTF